MFSLFYFSITKNFIKNIQVNNSSPTSQNINQWGTNTLQGWS